MLSSSTWTVKWDDSIMDEGNLRSQLSCCSVSEHFIVFGTNAGTLHIYDRDLMQRIMLVSSTEFDSKKNVTSVNTGSLSSSSIGASTTKRSITHVCISPNEEFVAVADSEHMVHILEFATNNEKMDVTTKNPKLSASHKEHVKTCVSSVASSQAANQEQQYSLPIGITCLCWSSNNMKIFSGDSQGFVFEFENAAERRKKSTLFLSSAPNRVLKEEGSIVQIHISDNLLLVSSTKRSVVVNLKEQKYCGIGSKPRDGLYGACFLSTPDRKKKNDTTSAEQIPLVEYVFAARPGRRLWCADKVTCKVLSTLKFPSATNASNLKFTLLYAFGPYVASWNSEGVVILDVVRLKVSDTRSDFGEVICVASHKDALYILHGTNRISRVYVQKVGSKPLQVSELKEGNLLDLNSISIQSPVYTSPMETYSLENRQVLVPTKNIDQIPLVATTSETKEHAQNVEFKAQNKTSTNLINNIILESDRDNSENTSLAASDSTSLPLSSRSVSEPETITTDGSFTPIQPLLILQKRKSKKKRKSERLIEFDERDSHSPLSATSGKISTLSKLNKATLDSIVEKSSSNLDTPTNTADIESQVSIGSDQESRMEIDLYAEMSDNNEELEVASSHSSVTSETTLQSATSGGKTAKETNLEGIFEIQETLKTVSEANVDSKADSNLESTDLLQSKIPVQDTKVMEADASQNVEKVKESSAQVQEQQIISTNNKKEERENIEKERKERERLEQLRLEVEKKLKKDFEANILSKLETLADDLKEFLLTNENTMWFPSFLPSVHQWAKYLIHSAKEEKQKAVNVIDSSLASLSKNNQTQFVELVNYWFKALVEKKIENDTNSSLEDVVSAIMSVLHRYLDMRTAINLCNEKKLLSCIDTIFKIEVESEYLINQRKEIEALIVSDEPNGSKLFDKLMQVIRKYDLSNPSIPLRYLTAIFQLAFDEANTYCASMYPQIQIWNVEQAIDRALKKPLPSFNYADIGKQQLYLVYLVAVFEQNLLCSQDLQFMIHFFDELSKFISNIAENRKGILGLTFGKARGIVTLIMNQAVQKENVLSSEVHKLEKILSDNGCNDILFAMYETMGNEKKLIQMLVKNSKSDEYSSLEDFMGAHSKVENWITLLESAYNMRDQNVIKTEQIISMMCMMEGSVQTLQILKDCSNAPYFENLNALMYKKICELAKAEARQSKLRHELLEIVDSYMWSQKEAAISPQIQALLLLASSSTTILADKNNDNKKRNIQLLTHLFSSFKLLQAPSENTIAQQSTAKQESSKATIEEIIFNFEHKTSFPRFNEDAITHWGTAIDCRNNNKCAICRLAIKEEKSPEIIIFSCNHAYHSSCLSIQTCTVCESESFTSILDD